MARLHASAVVIDQGQVLLIQRGLVTTPDLAVSGRHHAPPIL